MTAGINPGSPEWIDLSFKNSKKIEEGMREFHEMDCCGDANKQIVVTCTTVGAVAGACIGAAAFGAGALPGAAGGAAIGFTVGMTVVAVKKSIEQGECILF